MISFGKKIAAVLVALSCSFPFFSESSVSSSVEVGLGSGFVFYGSKSTRDFVDAVPGSKQFVANVNAAAYVPLADFVSAGIGFDTFIDGHWGDGDSIYLWDYSFQLGTRIYPGLAGLCLGIDYAIGRRTDFCDLSFGGERIDCVRNTGWGNGFIFSAAYDFAYGSGGIAPVVGFSWKHMPRGNASDNILSVSLKIKK
ncbi:hypothetical protein [Treponema saccharophilum]|uniref:Outer membrane protein beta-barrel domain-containing protein n=1 Tax=Treponema saccharophilum DSM 2985 TaxID=907348 RepID=H7EN65_9SPIR|nr:hypothetical protein [Treponema saccharophilum]EIC01129.1 hypothetical protein TresaDRAFT_0954 [Treponema saccharophilum DSM 2985]BDC95442.1 hypothetical protein TRSA_05410 [Treponema saccharophilum]